MHLRFETHQALPEKLFQPCFFAPESVWLFCFGRFRKKNSKNTNIVFLDVESLELQENAVKTMVLLHLDPFCRLFFDSWNRTYPCRRTKKGSQKQRIRKKQKNVDFSENRCFLMIKLMFRKRTWRHFRAFCVKNDRPKSSKLYQLFPERLLGLELITNSKKSYCI